MSGSIYERRDSVPHHSSLRDRMRAELEAFGPYAVCTDTQGNEPGSVSAPVRRGTTGETVIAHFAIASGPGAGADAPECLATFKPRSTRPLSRRVPHHSPRHRDDRVCQETVALRSCRYPQIYQLDAGQPAQREPRRRTRPRLGPVRDRCDWNSLRTP